MTFVSTAPVPLWITDLVIGLSYFAISSGLAIALRDRYTHMAHRFLFLFSTFIVLCGCGHLIDAWYGWNGQCSVGSALKSLCNLGTASASALTALVVLPKIGDYIAVTDLPFQIIETKKRLKELEANVAELGEFLRKLEVENFRLREMREK